MKLTIINETLIEYHFAETISLQMSEVILKIYHYLSANLDYQQLGLIEITPCFTSIAIAFKSSSPLFNEPDYLRSEIIHAAALPVNRDYSVHTIELLYNGQDLDAVCSQLQLTQKEFIQRHQQPEYTIAMLGFKGNFPYLLGLDPGLVLPRRASPRKRVKKGSVAIGSEQCGIYAEDSPGGWHIIGNTDFTDFAELRAGDKIIFKSLEKGGSC